MKTFLTYTVTVLLSVFLTLGALYYSAQPYLFPYTLAEISAAYQQCQNWTKQFPEGSSRCVLAGGYRLQLKIDPKLLEEKPLPSPQPSI